MLLTCLDIYFLKCKQNNNKSQCYDHNFSSYSEECAQDSLIRISSLIGQLDWLAKVVKRTYNICEYRSFSLLILFVGSRLPLVYLSLRWGNRWFAARRLLIFWVGGYHSIFFDSFWGIACNLLRLSASFGGLASQFWITIRFLLVLYFQHLLALLSLLVLVVGLSRVCLVVVVYQIYLDGILALGQLVWLVIVRLVLHQIYFWHLIFFWSSSRSMTASPPVTFIVSYNFTLSNRSSWWLSRQPKPKLLTEFKFKQIHLHLNFYTSK